MVQLAAFPKCYIEQICEGSMSLFEWIRRARELEPDGLELYAPFLTSTRSEYLNRVRRAAHEAGFSLPMLCYSPDFITRDPAERRAQVCRQREMIEVTAALGGKFCRTLSGQKRPDIPLADGIGMVVDAIRDCLDTAAACGVCLVMENHYKDTFWEYPEFAQQQAVFVRIVEAIESPWFGVQFDPSNSIVAGEDPLELLDAVRTRVRTMHASDRYLEPGFTLAELRAGEGSRGYSEKLRHGVVGQGLNDYERIFSVLRDAGFDGWISIEDGMNGMAEMRESLDFLRALRTRFFSGTGSATTELGG